MLTCIACSKQLSTGGGSLRHHQPHDDDNDDEAPSTRQAIKAITAQLKDMAVKASGPYRHCNPCAGSATAATARRGAMGYADSEEFASGSERFQYCYRRAASGAAAAGSGLSTPRAVDAAALPSSAEGTPSTSFRRTDSGQAAKEWVAQVEPGVLITFLPLPHGGANDLKRIRFSRELFNKWQAQRWWAENYDRVMELYNVQRFNHQSVPLPTPARSVDESSKVESIDGSPVTPPLGKEHRNRKFHMPMTSRGMGYSPSDLQEQRHSSNCRHSPHYYDSGGLASTPKLSSISGAKSESCSMDDVASIRTNSSLEEDLDRSASNSVSSNSDQETEWVEQDHPGVYITIGALPGGVRELRRVRFSRERFGEMHARLWWEENRARIHRQYL